MPRLRKIAPFGQRSSCTTEPVDRTIAVTNAAEDGSARPPQCPPQTFGWTRKRILEPGLKCAPIELFGLWLGEHGEQRIDARLNRTLANQFSAEAMDGVDVRFLQLSQRIVEAIADRRVDGVNPRAFHRFAESQLQLSGSLLGERDRDDLVHPRASGFEH